MSRQSEVLVKPDITDKDFLERCKEMDLSKKEKKTLDSAIANYGAVNPMFDKLPYDSKLLSFVLFLCEANGSVLSAIFHELYHKWQFTTSPFLYFVDFTLFKLFPYSLSSKCKYSIEGDVRLYVDNEVLHSAIGKFYNTFYTWLYLNSRINLQPEEKESLLAQLESLKQEDFRNFKFIELFVNSLL